MPDYAVLRECLKMILYVMTLFIFRTFRRPRATQTFGLLSIAPAPNVGHGIDQNVLP